VSHKWQIALIIVGLVLMINHLVMYGRLMDINELPFCHGFYGAILFTIGITNWNHWWLKL
jgi:hypothetical protein